MDQSSLRFGPFELDAVRRTLSRNGEPVQVRPMAIALLCYLANARERVVSKEELLEALWPDGSGTEANLTVTVAAVRRALGEAPHQHQIVLTVPRQGYRFVAEVGSQHRAPMPGLRTLALLPVETLGADPEPASDIDLPSRIRSAISRHVQSLEQIDVILPTEEQLTRVSLEELSDQTGADCLLLSTLEYTGASAELQLRMVDAQGREKWIARVTHPVVQLHTLPLRAARDIIGFLDPDRGRGAAQRRAGQGDNSEAWRAYTQARYHYGSGDGLPALHRAVVAYQQAVELEPELAAAHAGLAEALMILRTAAIVDPDSSAERIREAAECAFRHDPLLAESHLAMALVRMVFDHDWQAASEHLMTAQEFGPHNPWVHMRHAIYLAWRRQFEAALEEIRRAQSLEPHSMRITSEVARIHHFAGQSDVALSVLESATNHKLDFATGWLIRTWILLGLGDGDSALSALQPVRAQIEGTALWHALVGTAHGVCGRAEPAQSSLIALRERRGRAEYVPHQFDGMIQLALGDFAGSMRSLELAAAERYGEFPIIEADPLWAPLRSWPAYERLRLEYFDKSLIDG
jgi:DNA-binding winged helix-turn-helix (wHTH) protein/Flp pilus assembly protein TadD